MTQISISIEGQTGLSWPRWKKLVAEFEEWGFAGLFRSDHFTMPEPPDEDSLELIVSLTYLADHTQRIHFGPLVAPLSFRDPVMLARQAAALDDLSNGRMVLGVGAGWEEREHTLFGYNLGDMKTRMGRLEEGLEVISRLLRNDEPVTYKGRFYQLQGATLLPRPGRINGPPVMVGGNGLQRTLPLAARFADIWNGVWLSPDGFRELSIKLDNLLVAEGREPNDLKRTMASVLVFGKDNQSLDQRMGRIREWDPSLAEKPLNVQLETIRSDWNAIAGTPEVVIEQIRAYTAVGVEELMLQYFDNGDLDGLREFAKRVLPKL